MTHIVTADLYNDLNYEKPYPFITLQRMGQFYTFFCDPRGEVLPLGYRLCSIVTILHADNSTTLTLHAY